MRLSDNKLRRIESDLGLNLQFIKGQDLPVRNCWHFTTDGNYVDAMFLDNDDFKAGMNRIYFTLKNYDVFIIAFCLMDTHVHFILHGDFDECNRFIHEYIRRTSMYIFRAHGERKKLKYVPINYQKIDNDRYLKNAICYTLKNPPVGGLDHTAFDYPWSNGALLLAKSGHWCSPGWERDVRLASELSLQELRCLFPERERINPDVRIIDGIVYPEEYTCTEVVQRIFRSKKGFNYYLCHSRESDVESISGAASFLSIPMQELRAYKSELCIEMFGHNDLRLLNTDQRLKLARTLKARYNGSSKQILRLCGLLSSEVKL